MSDDDVEQAFKLYCDYTDVVGYSKVVTLEELRNHDYTLSVNTYIERPPVPPMDRKRYVKNISKQLQK